MTNPTISVVVVAAEDVAQDVRHLRLARLDGLPLPPFTPGAHIDLHLGPNLVRQYSLCGHVGDTSNYSVAVKREPESRGGSKAVHDDLHQGSQLEISAPRNNFSSAKDARHSILVAGGIGITPMLCMAHELHGRGKSFELLYFCRSPAHAAFLQTLQQGPFAERCRFFFGLDRDAVASTLDEALARPIDGAHVYLCGPRPFMDLVQELARPNWSEDSIHLEYFSSDALALSKPSEVFEVELARSSLTLRVGQDETIADAVRNAGVAVETSCEQGVCGTCITQVIDGLVDHRDSFLSSAERARGDCMAICVSRARSARLVLDL
ncbi:vanillate O-demethylase ferredoxin subunit [Variovorax boronicumulans]|uniref:PDR/VanB family oxidoreductase n=1 Tax=Variovorax boronicumulans TaxID=436515 RepID=UPI0027841211|nr:PDR/VanB family oxidoreductase [Variovorax boronicumulans]MDQ0073409.1 vanillate O-demethylase ferredoxin subunit [Variovorax boronicumulans]